MHKMIAQTEQDNNRLSCIMSNDVPLQQEREKKSDQCELQLTISLKKCPMSSIKMRYYIIII